MKTRREVLALAIVLALAVLLPASAFGYQASRSSVEGVRVIDVVARTPADGGWQPEVLRVNLGERVRLRISSADVVHGFAIPALGVTVDEVLPGHVEDVEFVASRAGRFAFACTRWCSPDHWRMRGTLEVVDAGGTVPRPIPRSPLYQRLRIDPDAVRAPAQVPASQPSANAGLASAATLPPQLQDPEWRRAHSPQDAFALLRAQWAPSTSDQDLWNLVALAWLEATSSDALATGERIYAQDCAACHGESGRGDGPAGRNLPGRSELREGDRKGPADFTDAARMLSASDALLQGKMLRGGMGTGMPEWGSLYDDDTLWALVAYLRSFSFGYGR
ncbi:MAG: c-type cytochrome [Chloroflexota bacterium]